MLGELFDPKAELLIEDRLRPHWSQSGAIVFVTFRTRDSIPQTVIRRWEREKNAWMRRHGYDQNRHWSVILPTLPEAERGAFNRQFNRCREEYLDTCHGACVLRRPELMQRQFDSWLHYTAAQINRTVGTRGHFWQQEPFDHLVRSPEQYQYLLKYIADNPAKAKLKPGEFIHRRYEK